MSTKNTTITKATAQSFRADFDAAMKSLSAKYGLTIELGTITFNANELRGKVTAKNVQADAIREQKRKNSPVGKKYVGRTFVKSGVQYEIVDYVPTRRKYPLTAAVNGKRYKISFEQFERFTTGSTFSFTPSAPRRNK